MATQYKKSDAGSLQYFYLKVASGTDYSDSIDLNSSSLVAIVFPDMTSTKVVLQDSIDGTNFMNTYNTSGSVLTFDIESNKHYKLAPADCATFFNLRLKFDATEAADRNIAILIRGFN